MAPQPLLHSSAPVLEFDAVRELLRGYTSSPLGRARIAGLTPSIDHAWIEGQQELASEIREFRRVGGRFTPISSSLSHARHNTCRRRVRSQGSTVLVAGRRHDVDARTAVPPFHASTALFPATRIDRAEFPAPPTSRCGASSA